MSDTQQLRPNFHLKVGGAFAPKELMAAVQTVTVESSLHLPDVATLTLLDNDLRWTDSDTLMPGTQVEVFADNERGRSHQIFNGEVVEFEPAFDVSGNRLVVRAFDRLHRLGRGQFVRRFIQSTAGDVIKKVAQEVGLKTKLGPTTVVHPYIVQANETNLAFLQRLAANLGYLLYVDGETLHCEPPKPEGAAVELTWGIDLLEFRPRISTIGQLNEVHARVWDLKNRTDTPVQAQPRPVEPKIGEKKSGAQLTRSAYNLSAAAIVADRPLRSQSDAQLLTQAIADRQAGRFIEAEGGAGGNPALVAGATLRLRNLGNRFSGQYFVTEATHTLGSGEYSVRFSISGMNAATLINLLAPEPEGGIGSGLALGVVTDNNDPEKLGRVKVKYPWLSKDLETDWIRVASIGAGPKRGICILPEINDEVLLGFELGDFHHPYVIGGLWNGRDKPPPGKTDSDYPAQGGKVLHRVIRGRGATQLRVSEDAQAAKGEIQIVTAGKRSITITDNDNMIEIKTGQHKVLIDDNGRVVSLESSGDLKLMARGKIVIQGQTGVEVKSDASLSVQANAAMDLKSNGTATLQANATLDVKSSAVLTVQGTLVKIN